ncbi:hypothetical protein ONZ45_g13827 [Pleurotus djamor]|nr:hypothetical protein ONZ45_g13827 [Pleurotus djamor]
MSAIPSYTNPLEVRSVRALADFAAEHSIYPPPNDNPIPPARLVPGYGLFARNDLQALALEAIHSARLRGDWPDHGQLLSMLNGPDTRLVQRHTYGEFTAYVFLTRGARMVIQDAQEDVPPPVLDGVALTIFVENNPPEGHSALVVVDREDHPPILHTVGGPEEVAQHPRFHGATPPRAVQGTHQRSTRASTRGVTGREAVRGRGRGRGAGGAPRGRNLPLRRWVLEKESPLSLLSNLHIRIISSSTQSGRSARGGRVDGPPPPYSLRSGNMRRGTPFPNRATTTPSLPIRPHRPPPGPVQRPDTPRPMVIEGEPRVSFNGPPVIIPPGLGKKIDKPAAPRPSTSSSQEGRDIPSEEEQTHESNGKGDSSLLQDLNVSALFRGAAVVNRRDGDIPTLTLGSPTWSTVSTQDEASETEPLLPPTSNASLHIPGSGSDREERIEGTVVRDEGDVITVSFPVTAETERYIEAANRQMVRLGRMFVPDEQEPESDTSSPPSSMPDLISISSSSEDSSDDEDSATLRSVPAFAAPTPPPTPSFVNPYAPSFAINPDAIPPFRPYVLHDPVFFPVHASHARMDELFVEGQYLEIRGEFPDKFLYSGTELSFIINQAVGLPPKRPGTPKHTAFLPLGHPYRSPEGSYTRTITRTAYTGNDGPYENFALLNDIAPTDASTRPLSCSHERAVVATALMLMELVAAGTIDPNQWQDPFPSEGRLRTLAMIEKALEVPIAKYNPDDTYGINDGSIRTKDVIKIAPLGPVSAEEYATLATHRYVAGYRNPFTFDEPGVRFNPWLHHSLHLRLLRLVLIIFLSYVAEMAISPRFREIIDHEDTPPLIRHYFYSHCALFRCLRNDKLLVEQGFSTICVHQSNESPFPTELPTRNPLLTKEEDEFLAYAAQIFELDGSLFLGNALRRVRGLEFHLVEELRLLFDLDLLDPAWMFDGFGARYPVIWYPHD